MTIMKKLFLLATAALTFSLLSCSKDNGDEVEEEEGMVFMGNVTLYLTKTPDCDNVEVHLQTEDLTQGWSGSIPKTSLTTSTPSCSQETGYTFKNIKYGKYKFNTTCGIQHVNGTVTVDKECVTMNVDFD
jgi:hypothetical protein